MANWRLFPATQETSFFHCLWRDILIAPGRNSSTAVGIHAGTIDQFSINDTIACLDKRALHFTNVIPTGILAVVTA